MDELVRQTLLAENLDSQSDDALHDVIDQARSILAARENERKKLAVAEIRRIAREHGLDVAVGKPARKRGNSRKSDSG